MLDADLLVRIRQIWEAARSQAARSVNSAHVAANWLIGQQIVEAEQLGKDRAEYGQALLKRLSRQLADDYGAGFSVSALQYMRAFYLAYPTLLGQPPVPNSCPSSASREIQHALRVISPSEFGSGWNAGRLHSALSRTHYRALLKVTRAEV